MIRLHVVAEGQTEQRFVQDVLTPHLASFGVFVDVRCVMTSRDGPHFYRGGLRDYGKPRWDITAWMKQDSNTDARFTSMFDLYALPEDFPGYAEAKREVDPYSKVARLEERLAEDISDPRFIPYIQLHEFEALLLADPRKLDWEFLEHGAAIESLVKLTEDRNPEEIDDGETTAPSKRIIAAIPEYEGRKPSAGPIVAEKIGLATLRERCRHFDDWVTRLEAEDNR